MIETEVKLNWFERHLNWTYSIVTFLAISSIITLLYDLIIRLSILASTMYWELVLICCMIIIVTGIWVLIKKGRSMWFIIGGLWPLIPAIPLLTKSPYEQWFPSVEGYIVLFLGMLINIVIVLLLSNIKYKRIITNENGKSVEKWYKIEKPANN
ncbi:MAG: hypothetical protein PHO26_09350 [Dehalococcoidia bacterium]|nr:hypothetical protein [Dehalococcoidia bacterium]MDD5495308.1 hypothetical protein [Dehalococcoidia bacterium]